MRYIDVGNTPGQVEQVADLKLSPNGEDWFLAFDNTNSFIQRYNSTTDEKVADISLGNYYWDGLAFSPDSRFLFVTSKYWHKLAVVDLHTNALVETPYAFPQQVIAPAVHPTRQEIYLLRHQYQSMYVLDYDDTGQLSNLRAHDLAQSVPGGGIAGIAPQQLLFLPDGSKFFVSCWNSDEVRVYDGQSAELLDVIAVPDQPERMALSPTTGQLFVSCTNDLASWNGAFAKRGSVTAISTSDLSVTKTMYAGYQPRELLVDAGNGVLVVLNRNNETDGPASHHSSTCGEKNGYVTLIDLQSLELVPEYKAEVLADPYTVAGKW